ncbi:MAG: choloylglycine hydrolase [Clostridiales bacterium]|nr:choloylglycine hydrolase [Clostridiales bacterium]
MCTAATYKTKDHYFGRNLDYEFSYSETVTVTPRNYKFDFRAAGSVKTHYAMIGMAFVQQNYPLYYDATNEKGLSMAGLNFPGNAVYLPKAAGKDNITPFEFIPWILGQCATVREAREKLKKINLLNEDFTPELKLSPLHWMISDRDESIVVEPLEGGVKVYDNPVGVMTNNPTFDFHLTNLANYMGLTRDEPVSRFSQELTLKPYSRGMGAIGLPGDLSSASRFVKAAFTKLNSISGESESESVSQFFHILNSVAQQRGCCKVEHGFEYTIYSSCCNTDKGIYYYTTYENSRITGVDMHKENLDGKELVSYPLEKGQTIKMQN